MIPTYRFVAVAYVGLLASVLPTASFSQERVDRSRQAASKKVSKPDQPKQPNALADEQVKPEPMPAVVAPPKLKPVITSLRGIELGESMKGRKECPKERRLSGLVEHTPPRVNEPGQETCWSDTFYTLYNAFALSSLQIHGLAPIQGMFSIASVNGYGDAVEVIETSLVSSQYEALRAALVTKYGPFDAEGDVIYTNGFGAKKSSRRAVWSTEDGGTLEIEEMTPGYKVADLGTVRLTSGKWYRIQQERKSRTTSDAVKGL